LFFLRAEFKRRDLRVLVLCGLLCLVVAVGFDFIEGLSIPHGWYLQAKMADAYDLDLYAIRHFSKSVEEFIEMLGMPLFWVAFIKYLSLLIQNGIEFFPKTRLIATKITKSTKMKNRR
jgi:hypothetical protein